MPVNRGGDHAEERGEWMRLVCEAHAGSFEHHCTSMMLLQRRFTLSHSLDYAELRSSPPSNIYILHWFGGMQGGGQGGLYWLPTWGGGSCRGWGWGAGVFQRRQDHPLNQHPKYKKQYQKSVLFVEDFLFAFFLPTDGRGGRGGCMLRLNAILLGARGIGGWGHA